MNLAEIKQACMAMKEGETQVLTLDVVPVRFELGILAHEISAERLKTDGLAVSFNRSGLSLSAKCYKPQHNGG